MAVSVERIFATTTDPINVSAEYDMLMMIYSCGFSFNWFQ